MRFPVLPVDHTSTVRRMLTLMFMLVRSTSLGLELGAHLLEEFGETVSRHWARRAHPTVRVVHVC